MLTRCPDCQTTFLITDQQLAAAGGKARCGRCGVVFDARAALLPEPQTASGASQQTGTQVQAPAPQAAAEPAPPETSPPPAAKPADDAIPAALLEDFEAAAKPRTRHGWLWTFLIVVLSLTLVVQYGYFMRTQLVDRFPQSRPWLVQMCSVLSAAVPCEVPYAKNLARLRMLSSEVSEHPRKPNALLIQATFVNTAPFTQSFPTLEVKLSDLHGKPVALRRFRPEEYVRSGIDVAQGLAPRTPVTALIEVARPYTDVNSYSFAFY